VSRTIIPSILAALLVVVGIGPLFVSCKEPTRPNVVVIVIDTLRADHLPPYGYAHDTAPLISELARDGVVFERAYSTSSWTAPATASLFTSLYPLQHGVVTGMVATVRARRLDPTITLNAIPEEAETLPEVMQRAGYRTFGVADNLNICAAEGFDQGFDAFRSYNDRGAVAVNAQVQEWKDEMLAPGAPYFLYVHYMDPHKPYVPQQPWRSRLGETGTPEVSAYDSEIRHVDEHLRDLFDSLGWDENTIVVVTSDHGEEFGEHGEFGHGHNLHNETVQVPLLVYPASAFGRNSGRVGEPVSLVDLLPTLREVAGVPTVQHEEGRSLLELLRNKSDPIRDRGELFAHLQRTRLEYPDGGERIVRAVIAGADKYMVTLPEAAEELYDLVDDAGETANLAAARPGRSAELANALEEFERTCHRLPGVTRTIEMDEQQLEKLRSLGYVN
jgi:arylsulfatase A-like enzyme